MANGTMMSCCLICATSSSSFGFTSLGGKESSFNRGADDASASDNQSGGNHYDDFNELRPIYLGNGTIKEQLQVIFILRDILELKGGKVEELINVGQLHSGAGIQLCGTCGEEAKRCHEAVLEMAKLQRKVANLSSVLKGKLCESWMEEGDGKDSTCGQIRLQVLRERGLEVGVGGVTNVAVASSAGSRVTLLSRARVFDDVQIDQNFGNGGLPTGDDVIDKSTNQCDDEECGRAGGGEQDADVEASSEGELEEQELMGHTTIKTTKREREETPSPSSSSSNPRVPVIINTYGYGAVRPSEENSPCEPRKDKENRTPANQSVAVFQCARCAKTYHSKQALLGHSKTHLVKYICKICKRSYPSEKTFKQHLKRKTCLRPVLSGPKTSCRYCGHGFYAITNHEKGCRKNEPTVPKTPCRHCGIRFLDRKRHERVCKKNVNNKPADYSWKQHLRLENISDAAKESDSDSDIQL